MRYAAGRIGRCFVVRFEHGDDILEGLSALAEKEELAAAVFYLLGGLKEGRIVAGPEREEMPPEPVWREIAESHETVGVGTIFRHDGKPAIHFHGVYGKRDAVKAGCLRENAKAFIVMEAVVLEMEGIAAKRERDAISGMVLLDLKGSGTPETR